MTQEQKAKAYDRALEIAKAWCKLDNNDLCNDDLETLFPELKESKDEKMRKGIIKFLIDVNNGAYTKSELEIASWITWLEKQGKKTSWKPSKEEMDALYGLAYITNQYDEHKEEVISRLYQDLKREFFNGSNYENMFPNTEDGVRRRSTIQVLEYAKSLNSYNQYGKADIDKNIDWLEKQGEKNYKIIKGKNYFCVKTHNYAGVEWIKDIKYYASDNYTLVNQGCKYYCPEYSKEEHNNLFEEVKYDGCVEKQGEEPKWTEEDEKNLCGIIDEIEANKSEAPGYDIETYDRFLSWLDNIKQRINNESIKRTKN